MRDQKALPQGVVNAVPAEAHRRQMARQVWLPLILTMIVVLALSILAIIGTIQGSPQVNRWGNISAVLVIIPVLIGGVVLLALVGGSAYGVSKLLKKTPGLMLRLQLFFARLSQTVQRISDKTTQPIFAVNAFNARVAALWNKIFRRKRSVK